MRALQKFSAEDVSSNMVHVSLYTGFYIKSVYHTKYKNRF